MALYIPQNHRPSITPSTPPVKRFEMARPTEKTLHHGEWTPRKLDRFYDRMKRSVYGYLKPKQAEAVEAVLREGSGANGKYNKSEILEVAQEIKENHLELEGLESHQAEKIADLFVSGPEK